MREESLPQDAGPPPPGRPAWGQGVISDIVLSSRTFFLPTLSESMFVVSVANRTSLVSKCSWCGQLCDLEGESMAGAGDVEAAEEARWPPGWGAPPPGWVCPQQPLPSSVVLARGTLERHFSGAGLCDFLPGGRGQRRRCRFSQGLRRDAASFPLGDGSQKERQPVAGPPVPTGARLPHSVPSLGASCVSLRVDEGSVRVSGADQSREGQAESPVSQGNQVGPRQSGGASGR